MIWRDPEPSSAQPDAIRHKVCGGSVYALALPGWGKCDKCKAEWSHYRMGAFPLVEKVARFSFGYFAPGTNERRVWVETGGRLHGALIAGLDADEKEGVLSDGRRWYSYDHPYCWPY